MLALDGLTSTILPAYKSLARDTIPNTLIYWQLGFKLLCMFSYVFRNVRGLQRVHLSCAQFNHL